MDAKEYDRIADLLMQIRKKYVILQPKEEVNQHRKNIAIDYVNALLVLNERFAERDAAGWL